MNAEQRARELLADVFAENDAWMHAQTVRAEINIDVPMEMALIAITRALTRPAPTDAEVEAAAKRIAASDFDRIGDEVSVWEALDWSMRNKYLRMARAALGVGDG